MLPSCSRSSRVCHLWQEPYNEWEGGRKSHLFTLPLSICQVVIEASENLCHEVESFFTWDALRGINLDILTLLVDGILLFLLLVLIESKALARLWYTQDKLCL